MLYWPGEDNQTEMMGRMHSQYIYLAFEGNTVIFLFLLINYFFQLLLAVTFILTNYY